MKYQLRCCNCGHRTPDFTSWFGQKQFCPICGGRHVEAIYDTDYSGLKKLFENKPASFWNYF
ncbi:MAG TPA: hypothetical protein DEQ30_07140, partial [Porphyromonadaceae bacterium]|nr:hypothetical protein [Porphyromonadaceae bacterium]